MTSRSLSQLKIEQHSFLLSCSQCNLVVPLLPAINGNKNSFLPFQSFCPKFLVPQGSVITNVFEIMLTAEFLWSDAVCLFVLPLDVFRDLISFFFYFVVTFPFSQKLFVGSTVGEGNLLIPFLLLSFFFLPNIWWPCNMLDILVLKPISYHRNSNSVGIKTRLQSLIIVHIYHILALKLSCHLIDPLHPLENSKKATKSTLKDWHPSLLVTLRLLCL